MCPRQRKTSSITSHSTVWSNSRQFGRMQLVKTDGETEMKNRLRLRFLPLWRFEKEEAIQLECFRNTITEDYSQTEPRHAFHLRDTLNCCSLHVYKEYLKVGLLKGLFLTFNVVFNLFLGHLFPFPLQQGCEKLRKSIVHSPTTVGVWYQQLSHVCHLTWSRMLIRPLDISNKRLSPPHLGV